MELKDIKPSPMGDVPGSPENFKLNEFRPLSVFNINQTHVTKARFSAIDMHAHAWDPGTNVNDWVNRMEVANIEKTVVLSFETGSRFDAILNQYKGFGDRFSVWCGFDYTGYNTESNWTDKAIAELRRCRSFGAEGVGELGDKGVGEYYSSPVPGIGMHINDGRMDPLLHECGHFANCTHDFNLQSMKQKTKIGGRNEMVFGYIRRILLPFVFAALLFSCKDSKQTSETSAGAALDGLKVPEGFTIERAVDSSMITYPMFASFDADGRLFVFESDGSSPSTQEMAKKPPYHIRLLEDTDNDGVFDRSKIFADSLTYPKGGVFFKGSLYVTSAPDLLKLTDTDGDGVADKREVVLTGWVLNHNGALLGGPFFGPDGWLYLTDARRGFDITTKEGQHIKGSSARIWRCRPDGSDLESMSGGGYDNAVELAFMPSGETVGTMTYFIEPQGGMRDALMHWVEGGVYPKSLSVIQQDRFKLTGDLMPVMTKMARVAPSGILRYRGNALGKEFNGNLFSAEFNTGRVIRHQIVADGATFKTQDEPFITSTVSDIHLTDVVQDADGSLLVLNTGGWFIAGCPLSRVAKLDVRGGIYRIRRKDAKKVNDAWGRQIKFDSLSLDDIAGFTKDPRLMVSDNAIEHLIERGDEAVLRLQREVLESNDEQMRAAAVFALYRINTTQSINAVRSALKDNSGMVRTAAARVLGLARDTASIGVLSDMVQKDSAAVVRQAATALGQIGSARAVQSLLNSATRTIDRFAEHAIIYALIRVKAPSQLVDALMHNNAAVRKVSVIALDQMDSTSLEKKHVVPFLESDDPSLRSAGIWVASHHKDWADIVIKFLDRQLKSNVISSKNESEIRDLMITFSDNKDVQHLLAAQLDDLNSSVDKKSFVINVMNNATVNEMPSTWTNQLARQLRSGKPEIRYMALRLVEARNIKALNPLLTTISQDKTLPADFRLKALNARLSSDPILSPSEFSTVLQYLDNGNESPIRQLAARLLGSAKLSGSQLITLANEYIAKTEVFLLPSLIASFDGNSDAAVGTALVHALKSSSDRLENITEADLDSLLRQYPSHVKTSAIPLIESLRKKNEGRLAELQRVDSQMERGDVGQGRKLFFGKAVCSTCHAVQGEGSTFGPDLTNIGQIRSRHDILEAILYPSASFAREHETSKVVTGSVTYTGIIKDQFPEVIIVETGPGQRIRVQRKDIKTIDPQNISLMPPGLNKQLSNEELSDLMAYLISLPDGMSGEGGE